MKYFTKNKEAIFEKKRLSFVSLFLAIAFLVVFPFGSLAEDDGLDDELEESQEKLEELTKKKESYSNIVNLKQKEAEVYDAQVRSLSVQEEAVEEDIEENKEKLTQVERDIVSLIEDIEQKELVIELRRKILRGLMRDYYDQQQSGVVAMVLGASTENSLFVSQDRSSQLQGRVGEELEEIADLRDELQKDKEEFEGKKDNLENLHAQLEKQEQYLEGATKQKQTLLEKALTEKGKYAWRLDKVEEEIREIEQKIAEIEASKINNLNLNSLPPAKKGLLAYPVGSPVRITQYYGKTSFTRWYTFHNGVDFGAPTGSPIYAPADGKVIADGDSGNYAYGKWIAIEHEFDGKELVTIYGHLSKKRVDKGDKVDEGDKIGDIGSTGYSTGPHLHFGVYSANQFEISTINGEKIPTGAHVNPMRYLE